MADAVACMGFLVASSADWELVIGSSCMLRTTLAQATASQNLQINLALGERACWHINVVSAASEETQARQHSMANQ